MGSPVAAVKTGRQPHFTVVPGRISLLHRTIFSSCLRCGSGLIIILIIHYQDAAAVALLNAQPEIKCYERDNKGVVCYF